jgi:hypothetical protein
MVTNFGEELCGADRADVLMKLGILAIELKKINGNLNKIVYILVFCAFMIFIGLLFIMNCGCGTKMVLCSVVITMDELWMNYG